MPGAIGASTKPDTTTLRRTLAPARGRGRTTHRGDGREIFSPHWPTPTSLVSRWACYAARAVGSIPLMSGGLLVVEAVLVPGLVSGGMTLASAICAMLIYRLISWIHRRDRLGGVLLHVPHREGQRSGRGASGRGRRNRGSTAVQARSRSAARTRTIGSAACGPSTPPLRFSARLR
jgi:hypothetical protein